MRLFLLSVREQRADTRYRGELMEYKHERKTGGQRGSFGGWESKRRGEKKGL